MGSATGFIYKLSIIKKIPILKCMSLLKSMADIKASFIGQKLKILRGRDRFLDNFQAQVKVITFVDFKYLVYNRIMQAKKPDRFNKIEKLGEGTYGVVYKAEYAEPYRKPGQDQYIALKKIRLESQEQGIPSTAIRQISILKQLNHPNIVQLKQVIHSNKKLLLVFQYVDYDLKKFMSQINRQKGMDPMLVKSFCYQLLHGINYCHQKKILHRDLKPQNLLISKDHVLKIADFGLARASGIPTKGFTHEVVTLWYRPPDVLLGSQKYSNNIDIWSVGCIFAEMSNMKALFPGQKQQDELIRIFKVVGTPTNQSWPGVEDLPHWKNYQFEKYPPRELSEIVPRLDQFGIDLLKKMLQPNPYTRISAKDALIHPYFKDLPQEVLNLYKK